MLYLYFADFRVFCVSNKSYQWNKGKQMFFMYCLWSKLKIVVFFFVFENIEIKPGQSHPRHPREYMCEVSSKSFQPLGEKFEQKSLH